MKKFSVVGVLVCVAFGMMLGIVGTMFFGNTPLNAALFGYNPNRYITLGEYKGVALTWEEWTPTNEEIAMAMAQEVAAYATQENVEKDAIEGDVLTLDYVGKVDGKENDDFTNTTTVILGNDEFLVSGMDEYLLGADVGVPITATLTVPETYHVADYIDKQVEFTLTVTQIVRTNIPDLTDEFVKKLGDYSSVEDYKTKFAEKYKADYAAQERNSLRQKLFDTVVENTTVQGYPEKELNLLLQQEKDELQKQADEWGMSMYDYGMMVYGVSSVEEVDAQLVTSCQKQMKIKMVIKAIAREEGLKVTDDIYESRMAEYLAAEPDFTKEELVEYFGGVEGMKEQFLMEMVTDIIEQNAVITK